MREVNNNTTNSNNVNFQGIQPRKETASQEVMPQIDSKEITDLRNMPSDVIGRSQVAKSSSDKDVDFVLNNSKSVEDLNRYFDYLIDKQGLSYEDACSVIGGTAEEFYNA